MNCLQGGRANKSDKYCFQKFPIQFLPILLRYIAPSSMLQGCLSNAEISIGRLSILVHAACAIGEWVLMKIIVVMFLDLRALSRQWERLIQSHPFWAVQ